MRLRKLHVLRRGERGSVLVMVAVALPVLVAIGSMVIDVGNWLEHRRHLQTQADAGALAGATEFRFPCTDGSILRAVGDYAGDRYNPQVGGTPPANVLRAVNASTAPGQPDKVDATVDTRGPCAARMVDVKLAETGLPWFLRAANVSFINAHARVELRGAAELTGLLPLGVPDPNPKSAAAILVDETSAVDADGEHRILDVLPLTKAGNSGGLTTWTSAATAIHVPSPDVGVRIALSGSSTPPSSCVQALVTCYDAGGPDGLVHVRGWSSSGTGSTTSPIIRGVELTGGSCADPYFSTASSCTFGVQAAVDFGSGTPGTVKATAGKTTLTLTRDATTGLWSSSAGFTLNAGDGPVTVSLDAGCKSCKPVAVQRAFGATGSRSDPIRIVRVADAGGVFANSLQRCADVTAACRTVTVSVSLDSSLQEAAQSVSSPLVTLRLTGQNQTQALDCDPNVPTLEDELALGCGPRYEPYTGGACNTTVEPFTCVKVEPGESPNSIANGINRRILGDRNAQTCTRPSNWGAFPQFARDDPRTVGVFLTQFGAFSGTGKDQPVEVTGFATFYITGWAGQGNGAANPCAGNGVDDDAPAGTIVGHFIRYVDTVGIPTPDLCDPDPASLQPCITVLTR